MILSTLAVAVAGMKNRVRGWFASNGKVKPAKQAMQLDTRLVVLELNTHDWIPVDANDRPKGRMTFPMFFQDAFDLAVMLNRRTMLAPKLGRSGGNLHWFCVVRIRAHKGIGFSVLKTSIVGEWNPQSEYALPVGLRGSLMSLRDAVEECRAFNAKVLAPGVLDGKFQWMMPIRPLWEPRETVVNP